MKNPSKVVIEQSKRIFDDFFKIEEAGSIHTEMFDQIARDDIAVVDITTLNPNVFYELGIRHALKRNVTVLMREQSAKVPFNIQGLRVIGYDYNDVDSYGEARTKIQNFIRNGLSKNISDSPVQAVLPDLKVSFPSEVLKRQKIHKFQIKETKDKKVSIITGDIRNVRGIDDKPIDGVIDFSRFLLEMQLKLVANFL